MDLTAFLVGIIKINFQKLIGETINVFALEFTLLNLIPIEDVDKYNIADVLLCLKKIVGKTTLFKDNINKNDGNVLIDNEIAKKFINEIEKNNSIIF